MAGLDVLIAGAGPVGLTAALEPAGRGAAVRIFDREGSRSKLSKAIGINVQSLELLEPSGATERLLAAGIRIAHANLHFDGAKLVTLDLSPSADAVTAVLKTAAGDSGDIEVNLFLDRDGALLFTVPIAPVCIRRPAAAA